MTKQFTAAAILLLAEHSKLAARGSRQEALAGRARGVGRITIFNLLTHTSGYSELHRLPDYRDAGVRAVDAREFVRATSATNR